MVLVQAKLLAIYTGGLDPCLKRLVSGYIWGALIDRSGRRLGATHPASALLKLPTTESTSLSSAMARLQCVITPTSLRCIHRLLTGILTCSMLLNGDHLSRRSDEW